MTPATIDWANEPPPAQGELRIRRLSDAAPPVAWPLMTTTGDHYIVGHSETGHHHVLDRSKADVFEAPSSIGMAVLRVIVREPTVLLHQRADRPHRPIALPPGVYEITHDQEWDYLTQMARQSQD